MHFILICGCDLDSWSGSHIRWGQSFRLRHLTTGHYLALTDDRGLVLQDRERSDTIATAFCFRASKVRMCARIQGHKMNALDSVLFLKVTYVTWAQPHTCSFNTPGKEQMNPPTPLGLENHPFSKDNGNCWTIESHAIEVKLAELADYTEHLALLCKMEFLDMTRDCEPISEPSNVDSKQTL